MARIYEWQGKDLLRKAGIPVPRGVTIAHPHEAKTTALDSARTHQLIQKLLVYDE